METFSWSVLIGGFTFFFFGLRSARKGLERVAGDRLRLALSKITSNRFVALSFGVFVTLILQSSGATSAMLVSFADTGLLSLTQATAVLLGSDVGTTGVVILLSIEKITDYALAIVAAGFFLRMVAKSRKTQDIGRIIFGFGLIFYGMFLMTQSAAPLKDSSIALEIFKYLGEHPIATLVLSSIMAGAVHSAGMIGIAIALAFANAITFEAAVPIVLGANIGSCFTAVLAGLAGGVKGKRVALAHALSKVIGVALIMPFLSYLISAVNVVDGFVETFLAGEQSGIAVKIAIVHVLFNLYLAVIFLPLLGPLSKLVEKIIPLPPPTEEPFGPKFLDRSALSTPALAFAQAKREIHRIATIAGRMMNDCLIMFSRGEDHKEAIELMEDNDDKVDVLEKSVRFYLAEISIEGLSEDQSRRQMALLSIASDLEDIGDTLSRELIVLAQKKAKWMRFFSDDGWRDLRKFQSMVMENYNLMMLMLAQPHEEISLKLSRHEKHMKDVEQQLRQAHIMRLHQGLQESFDTSSIHLDILSNLRRINSKITQIAESARDLA